LEVFPILLSIEGRKEKKGPRFDRQGLQRDRSASKEEERVKDQIREENVLSPSIKGRGIRSADGNSLIAAERKKKES